MSRGRRIAASAAGALPLAAIILFVIVARLNLLSMPLERDDGTYAYLGQLVLDGQTPYVSFYETKPPLLYYAYAAVIRHGQRSEAGRKLGQEVCLVFLAKDLQRGR